MILLFCKMVLRHLAYASAVVFGLACLAERLAPGSVLSYVSLWPLVFLTFLIQIAAFIAPLSSTRAVHEGQRILLFGGGVTGVIFLALVVRETGLKGQILSVLALTVLVLVVLALSSRHSPPEEGESEYE